MSHSLPMPGAFEGVTALKNMGYHLVIITARNTELHTESWKWINKHFPGIINFIFYPPLE